MRPVRESQSRLQFGATHFARHGRHQAPDMIGNLRRVMFGLMYGDLSGILFGTLPGRRSVGRFVYRQTGHEPGTVLIALENRER